MAFVSLGSDAGGAAGGGVYATGGSKAAGGTSASVETAGNGQGGNTAAGGSAASSFSAIVASGDCTCAILRLRNVLSGILSHLYRFPHKSKGSPQASRPLPSGAATIAPS